MSEALQLPRFSLGVGDRFAHQAAAQLQACVLAAEAGCLIAPVWNKSNREHHIIGSDPASTRTAADAAVRALGWTHPYFVDADHINLDTFARFVSPCDFFTIDVADHIGKRHNPAEVARFLDRHPDLLGDLTIPGIPTPLRIDRALAERTATKFLAAVQHAGTVYRALAAQKGPGSFITEISVDETDTPQTPPELLLILTAIADEGIPLQTIAPKFTGRFNKGVDYVGNLARFTQEFRDDIATVAFAVARFGLPSNLKLSVHSGSDKFSLYGPMRAALEDTGAGVHLKTAGTTWLEELIGLAASGPEPLALVQRIYGDAFDHIDELCVPYASVIDIDRSALPSPATVHTWSAEQFIRALHHHADDDLYNPNLRQLLHVGFKVAARLGPAYTEALEAHAATIARNVTDNLFSRHIRPLFLG